MMVNSSRALKDWAILILAGKHRSIACRHAAIVGINPQEYLLIARSR
jgi:hypothetical protein